MSNWELLHVSGILKSTDYNISFFWLQQTAVLKKETEVNKRVCSYYIKTISQHRKAHLKQKQLQDLTLSTPNKP